MSDISDMSNMSNISNSLKIQNIPQNHHPCFMKTYSPIFYPSFAKLLRCSHPLHNALYYKKRKIIFKP